MMVPPRERVPSEQPQESFATRFFNNQYVKTATSYPVKEKSPSQEQIETEVNEVMEQVDLAGYEVRSSIKNKIETAKQVTHVLNALIMGVSAITVGFFVSKILLLTGSALTAVAIARGMEIPDSWETMQKLLKHELNQLVESFKKPATPSEFDQVPQEG